MITRLLSRLLVGLGVVLFRLGLARPIIRLNGRAPRVLLLHACEPEESPDLAGLRSNTPPAVLRKYFELLRTHYDVVALESLTADADLPRAPVVITFDDGYRSVGEHALPLLVEFGFPAAVYLVTDATDGASPVWVNEVRRLLHDHSEDVTEVVAAAAGLSPGESPARLIDGLRARRSAAELAALVRELRERVQGSSTKAAHDPSLFLGWDEVREMQASGVSFGNHTATHPSLPLLDLTEKREEVQRANRAFETAGVRARSFAFPFGDNDAESREVVAAVGFEWILFVGGVNKPWDPQHVARVPVHARSAAALFAEVEVLYPIKTFVKRCLDALRG